MFSRGALPFNGFEQALFGGAAKKGKGKKASAAARRNMQILGTLALLKQMRGRRRKGRKPGPKKGGKKKGGKAAVAKAAAAASTAAKAASTAAQAAKTAAQAAKK